MLNKKKATCGLMCALIACSIHASALSGISSWAQEEVSAAVAAQLEPDTLKGKSAIQNITRAEFCDVALHLYEAVTGSPAAASTKQPFTDTDSTAVATAYALGLVSGKTTDTFAPNAAINRQELCIMLDNILKVAKLEAPAADPEVIANFSDRNKLESWAEASVERMLSAGILRGSTTWAEDATGERTTITLLSPQGTTTREQALLLSLRFLKAFQGSAQPPQRVETFAPTEAASIPDNLLIVDPEGAGSPPAQANLPKEPTIKESPAVTTEKDPPVTAEKDPPAVKDPAVPHTSVPSPLPETEEEKMAYLFGDKGYFYATPEEAEAAMTEIEIPVWRLQSDGSKKSGKAYVVVNANLAPIYQAVFQEIYEGPEQFPIVDVGSYAWRASETSEHRWGTAIDINADANMECTIDELGQVTAITCGTHWTPGEDPLSIEEDGDVYRAFTKYGFSWGGNAWSKKRDYMHFSYFGR